MGVAEQCHTGEWDLRYSEQYSFFTLHTIGQTDRLSLYYYVLCGEPSCCSKEARASYESRGTNLSCEREKRGERAKEKRRVIKGKSEPAQSELQPI